MCDHEGSVNFLCQKSIPGEAMRNYKISRMMTSTLTFFRRPIPDLERRNILFVVLIPIYLLLCLPVSSLGVERPDAGRIMNNIKEQSNIPQDEPPIINLPEEEKTKPPLQMQVGEKVKVTAFRFSGNTVFDEKQLSALIASYVGRELTIAELSKATLNVEDYYHKNGYIMARAYLPAQKIKNGVVEIAILEGRINKVIIIDKDQEKRAPAPLSPVP